MNGSTNRTAFLWAAVGLVVVGVVGLVVLVLTGHDTAQLLGFLAGPLGALFVASQVYNVTGEQNTKLDKITAQTNGVLDKRILEGVTAALLAANTSTGVHGSEPVLPTDPPPGS